MDSMSDAFGPKWFWKLLAAMAITGAVSLLCLIGYAIYYAIN
jgi:hypothetical protein